MTVNPKVIETEQTRLTQIKELLFGDESRETEQSLHKIENQFNQKIEQLNQQFIQFEAKQQLQKQETNQQLIELSNQLTEKITLIEQQKVNRLELANVLEQLAKQLRQ